jgi:hypothetical protein
VQLDGWYVCTTCASAGLTCRPNDMPQLACMRWLHADMLEVRAACMNQNLNAMDGSESAECFASFVQTAATTRPANSPLPTERLRTLVDGMSIPELATAFPIRKELIASVTNAHCNVEEARQQLLQANERWAAMEEQVLQTLRQLPSVNTFRHKLEQQVARRRQVWSVCAGQLAATAAISEPIVQAEAHACILSAEYPFFDDSSSFCKRYSTNVTFVLAVVVAHTVRWVG